MKINGERWYTAVRPGTHDRQIDQTGLKELQKISLKALVRKYLCEQGESACVKQRGCEMLKICRYGQRYIELTEERPDERE